MSVSSKEFPRYEYKTSAIEGFQNTPKNEAFRACSSRPGPVKMPVFVPSKKVPDITNIIKIVASTYTQIRKDSQCECAVMKEAAKHLALFPHDIEEVVSNDLEKLNQELTHLIEICRVKDQLAYKTLCIAREFFQGKNPIHRIDSTVKGSGAFGDVYVVEILGETYAEKYIKPNKDAQRCAEYSASKTELTHIMNCDHDHIIQGVFQKDDSIYLELAQSSLASKFKESKDIMTAEHLLDLLRQLSEALIYMHERGYVHGDVKAENVLIDRLGQVKLGDFGTVIDISKDERVLGHENTPPEHLRNEITGSKQKTIDVWEFGLLIWSLLKEKQYSSVFRDAEYPYGIIAGSEHKIFLITVWDTPLDIDASLDHNKCSKYDPNGVLRTLVKKCLCLSCRDRPTMQDVQACLNVPRKARGSDSAIIVDREIEVLPEEQ